MDINTAHIWTDPERVGGRPCIRDHRITVAQMLMHLANGESISDIAGYMTVTQAELTGMLADLAELVDGKETK